ncbi:MAG: hypothetical protein HOF01_01145 [Chloroflexi bacterium]|jgi:hypothetical protein|nr:hypothetical protein [Chloroflexota bacterium]
MAKAAVSITTLILIAIVMVSILTALPDSLNGGGQPIQIAYSSDPANASPSEYAKSILSSR